VSSGAAVGNEWSCTSTTIINYLNNLHKDYSTFTFTFTFKIRGIAYRNFTYSGCVSSSILLHVTDSCLCMFLEELEVRLTDERYHWSPLPCRMKLKPRRYANDMQCIVGNTKDNVFIITNLIHKFLVHSHRLYKIKFLYMFRAQSVHHEEVRDVNCTYAASGIVSLCK
jgi:hypothetical protein